MTGRLNIDIAGMETLGESEIAAWRAMIAANPQLSSPYFRPEFAQTAARISPGAQVAVLHRAGKIAGFFPFQRRGGAVQPLGAPMNDYHGVVAYPGEAPDLHALAQLIKAPRLGVSAWVGPMEGLAARQCVMTELPAEGYTAWYAERRQSERKYFKDKERARRGLEADFGSLRVEAGQRDAQALDHLIELKRAQYRRTSRHDIFACGWTRDLLHALMAQEAADFGASIATLHAGDTLAAIEFSLHAGDRWHFWFPAYEPKAARCSPGIMLSMETMRLMSPLGYRVFDYGLGGEGYKKYFCNAVQAVGEGSVSQPGLGRVIERAASGALNMAGAQRGAAIRDSVRRRWAAIEACEITPVNRMKGAAQAAQAAIGKMKGGATA